MAAPAASPWTSLQHAQILRAPTSPTVVDTFLESGVEVAAGVKQQLEADARRLDGAAGGVMKH